MEHEFYRIRMMYKIIDQLNRHDYPLITSEEENHEELLADGKDYYRKYLAFKRQIREVLKVANTKD